MVDWFRDFFGWLFGRTTVEQAERAWKNSLVVVMVLGGSALIVYAASQPAFWPVFGGGVLIAAASALAGGFGGLIFGLPRSATSSSGGQATAQNPRQVAPNTNLVEVSDWLTKIIVGLGLTQLGSMPGDFQRLVDYARPALGSPPAATSVAAGLIVAYAIAGFMLTYLFTRLDLEAEMEAAEAAPDPDLKKLGDLSDLHAAKVLSDQEFEGLKGDVIAAFPAKLSQPEPLLRMLGQLSDLHAHKVLTDKEFEQLKGAVIAALPARLSQPDAH